MVPPDNGPERPEDDAERGVVDTGLHTANVHGSDVVMKYVYSVMRDEMLENGSCVDGQRGDRSTHETLLGGRGMA